MGVVVGYHNGDLKLEAASSSKQESLKQKSRVPSPLSFYCSLSVAAQRLRERTREREREAKGGAESLRATGGGGEGGKGISASTLPYKMAQDFFSGLLSFVTHGIAQVKNVTGSKILRILKAHGLAPKIPEDLYHLIKKAVVVRKHLQRSRKDKDSKFRLISSKIS
ncbi:unnamed protein product [Ilex paraguariensis]|uniref:40S ribosomal protein S13 n=1 Tax=Ilex paraguariensis TaxID=185542 RepID=A0ABC8TST4_9AQUA